MEVAFELSGYVCNTCGGIYAYHDGLIDRECPHCLRRKFENLERINRSGNYRYEERIGELNRTIAGLRGEITKLKKGR